MAIEQKDLYGFSTKVNPQQIAERLDCDDNMAKAQALWGPYVESNKLPADFKLKELVRKVCQLLLFVSITSSMTILT